ncbi:MAG: putative zinc-binding metallopeptidase [Bdellovibrionales bacterium]|nr:putative zinc-binding metallopeptidase [Bdellovibrionales bacterium]
MSDAQLLKLRFCDLGVSIEGSVLERRISILHQELDQRGIRFKPHCWLSSEWFAPEDVPGIAIPFYLADPRLRQLEKRQVYEVEGGSQEWCMKLLRHEAGHALDTAYQLYRKKQYRQTFGRASLPYPEHYTPRPNSRSFVLHLDLWYAQAHPVEDFAETFAVWLRYPKRWKVRYRGWKALAKLESVDQMMNEIAGRKALVTSRAKVDPISRLGMTLEEHYEKKRQRFGLIDKAFYDAELRRLFRTDDDKGGVPAAAFLRRKRVQLRSIIARWTGEYPYTIDQILQQMIERSKALELRAVGEDEELFREALTMLSVQVTSNVLAGRRKIPI